MQKVYIIRTMYTICVQNSYRIYTNYCMQNVTLISTYFDPVVVLFLGNLCKQLKLKT